MDVTTEISTEAVQQPTRQTSEAETGRKKLTDLAIGISTEEVQNSEEEKDKTIDTLETRSKSLESAAATTLKGEAPLTGNAKKCSQAQQRPSPRKLSKPSNCSLEDETLSGTNNESSTASPPAVHDCSQQDETDDFDSSVEEERVSTCAECLSILSDYEDDDNSDDGTNVRGNVIDPDSINMLLAAAEASTECSSESENQIQAKEKLATPSFG